MQHKEYNTLESGPTKQTDKQSNIDKFRETAQVMLQHILFVDLDRNWILNVVVK